MTRWCGGGAQNGAALPLAERDGPNPAVQHRRFSRQPGLILLDLRMPVMDGWEFAASYRRRPGPHAPIVVVTATRDLAESAASIGADALLAKPFELDDLLAVVARHIRR